MLDASEAIRNGPMKVRQSTIIGFCAFIDSGEGHFEYFFVNWTW